MNDTGKDKMFAVLSSFLYEVRKLCSDQYTIKVNLCFIC